MKKMLVLFGMVLAAGWCTGTNAHADKIFRSSMTYQVNDTFGIYKNSVSTTIFTCDDIFARKKVNVMGSTGTYHTGYVVYAPIFPFVDTFAGNHVTVGGSKDVIYKVTESQGSCPETSHNQYNATIIWVEP